MKTCIKCQLPKPRSMFYRHPKMKSGRLNKCKACCRVDASRNRLRKLRDPAWVRSERARCRIKQEGYRKAGVAQKTSNAVNYAWRRRNRDKARAHNIAARAQKRGDIKPPLNCQRCREPRPLQKHHPDYRNPLVVQWLCSPCHGIVHRKP